MEGGTKKVFTVQVEDGKPRKEDGRPAVGPVFRSALSKDGFPPLEPDMKTSWDVFRVAAGKYPDNRMLGWRPVKDGVIGPYIWKSYREVYEEVLQVGSALQQLGVKPGSRIGIYGSNCPQWIVAMQVKARLGGRLRLLISGGAPLSNEIEEFLRVTSCAYFIQGYGLTETLGPSTVCYPDDMSLVGTVGVAATYTELRLEEVPEMGYNPLGTPSRGEICVRGNFFTGYYKNPELTNEVMADGWFHTGDIGEMNSDGILKVIDRKKNIFKLSQGEYVAVEYLEKVYVFPPTVEDVWVYGDSFRSMLVAVVNPHEENTMKWAESNGCKGSFAEICKSEGLKEHILKELQSVAAKNKLRGFEYVKGVILDPIPFDLERDLVTATMKKKRNNMLKYYKPEIEKVYQKLEEQRVAAKSK
uniref:AMP-dependent synthetase/ligase domain-containing protein n=1 Tax=Oryza rufipogon TaxID=4529 RepID=A0A0E0PH47_ORYRU